VVAPAVKTSLAHARLYLVCEDIDNDFLDAALRGGVDLVQLRMKEADDKSIVAAARRWRPVCDAYGIPLILNDRPDLVAAAGADGVHVGQDDAAVTEARAAVGAAGIVGLSTHSPEQIDAVAGSGVDYIGVGPVYATPTKPGRPAVGTGLVEYAAEHASVPFFAIGGINAINLDAVLDAGATRVAVVRAITLAPDLERAASGLKSSLEGHLAQT
jgi:thiamine-phosphate pyrophosphorylase